MVFADFKEQSNKWCTGRRFTAATRHYDIEILGTTACLNLDNFDKCCFVHSKTFKYRFVSKKITVRVDTCNILTDF